MNKNKILLTLSTIATLGFSAPGYADKPKQWQLGFQEAVTPTMAHITDLHNVLLVIIGGVAVFVITTLLFILYRFRARQGREPSKRSHNPILEVIWTLVPVLILAAIAVPSFRLMWFIDKTVDPEMTVKVVANMWYWTYEYPEQNVGFDSNIIPDKDLLEGQLRLLSVDNEVVVPVNTNVRLLFTSSDVIHSWSVPSFGVKKDCIPGRLNETWIRVLKEGTYRGQCSELCGMNHGFMPIVVRAVAKENYQQWLAQAKEKFALSDAPSQVITQDMTQSESKGN